MTTMNKIRKFINDIEKKDNFISKKWYDRLFAQDLGVDTGSRMFGTVKAYFKFYLVILVGSVVGLLFLIAIFLLVTKFLYN